jgi:RNA polymerase sigma factor (sigma-70 family)
MATPTLDKLVASLREVLRPPDGKGLTDAQLLERFLAARDETAFATLVQRHGPLVFGVCRRVLGNVHDCEDAFQATFLILAQKARSVKKRGAIGSWLYTVAYRAALEARAARGRRAEREKQVPAMPHAEVTAPEPQDWRPLLDRELNGLPEKYRTAVVLCDLGGLTRKEAARQLGLPEGTVSGRLTQARRLLAKRLARYGVALSGGALAAELSQGAATAHVPTALVWSTAKVAALAAAGQLAAVTTPAAVLSKGVITTMFLAKLKAVVVTAVVVATVGVSVLVVRAGGSGMAQAAPPSELEELRKENELLKLNLRVTLEKIKAQEAELVALKDRAPAAENLTQKGTFVLPQQDYEALTRVFLGSVVAQPNAVTPTPPADPVADAEAALKALQAAKTPEEKRKAADALEAALKKLKEQLKGAP